MCDIISSDSKVTSGFYQDPFVITNIVITSIFITDTSIDFKVFLNPDSTELQVQLETSYTFNIIEYSIDGRSVVSKIISESSDIDFSALDKRTNTCTISNK